MLMALFLVPRVNLGGKGETGGREAESWFKTVDAASQLDRGPDIQKSIGRCLKGKFSSRNRIISRMTVLKRTSICIVCSD